MQRIACVDIPAFPLQLVRRAHPEWQRHAVVVVDKDSPRGIVQWANEAARRVGILPGLRYAAGLSLDAQLRATVVPIATITEAVAELTELLRRFSPTVEPSPPDDDPGLFWLDADGLSLLYPTLTSWADAVRAALFETKLRAGIAVGFSRFGSYATARVRAGRDAIVWNDLSDEKKAVAHVPLSRIGLDPDAREALAQLGVETLGQLQRLPEAGLRRRYGPLVHELHRRATGALEEPLTPALPEERFEQHLDFDDAVSSHEALVFFTKQLLDPLLGRLAARGQALRELVLELELERAAPRRESLRPAIPTLDQKQLLNLVQLRLEQTQLEGGARVLALRVLGQRATKEQLALFFDSRDQPRRDLSAGDRALARLRASLGDKAVVRAKLREGHLPEARFVWEALDKLEGPKPTRVMTPPIVRRFFSHAELLPPRPGIEPDGWMPCGIPKGPVEHTTGPFSLSGGWWNKEVRRDYYFVSLGRGALCWVYFDHQRKKWFLHGEAA